MKLFTALTSFFTILSAVVASPVDSGVASRAVAPHYKGCPYPRYNISVINFEYTEGQKLANHRGLTWTYFSGFKRYYGYGLDGWSPNPSNYTTMHLTWDGRNRHKPSFGSGPRATLKYVHSFWFYLGFVGSSTPPGTTVQISVWGLGGPSGSQLLKLIDTDGYHDGVWEHVCVDAEVSSIVFDVPSCTDQCKYAVFELDDIWVNASPLKPVKVQPPKEEYDNGKPTVITG